MSGFRDHFLDKYFAYRARYVAAVADGDPRRVRLAVVSEIARLGFVVAGTALLALVLWLLVVGAVGRIGVGARTIVFAACALATTYLGLRACVGLARALGAFGKV